ncbi:Mor transcription activator family protein [Romboutsia ilealis]|uniref:Mor transcription activator family protein n=1 Tax=Romboutsia faecis TaxID=2764597 RepID=A0ABR7JTW3_9FIRM|nr:MULTISPECIES: Mor transcription activator family protein [Romboutsia]MBC5998367.1 Mor transcription activator family protein [Romboutsia faecis]MRN26069.1 Mor transcription activator family protein [Romboutsia ilealis]
MREKQNDFKGIYAEMSEILGEEIVRIIYKNYKGQQINFPMKLHSNEYIEKYIIENYSKKSVREMSRELGYSDKWIQRLIKKLKIKEESFE